MGSTGGWGQWRIDTAEGKGWGGEGGGEGRLCGCGLLRVSLEDVVMHKQVG